MTYEQACHAWDDGLITLDEFEAVVWIALGGQERTNALMEIAILRIEGYE